MIKKYLHWVLGGMAMLGLSSAIAGGSEPVAMPDESPVPAFQESVYVDFHGGYAQVNWRDFQNNALIGDENVTLFRANDNRNGGFTGGADTGYRFTRHMALEMGWFYLPEVKGSGVPANGVSSNFSATVRSWFAYAAAKFTVPMPAGVHLFGKVGAAYRALDYSVPSAVVATLPGFSKHGHYWAPMFATGLQYSGDHWILGVQYLHVAGCLDLNKAVKVANIGAPDAAPVVNLYTAFVGYEFPA